MDGLHSTGLHLWEGMLAQIKAILNWDVHASLEFYVKEATFISFSSLYHSLVCTLLGAWSFFYY